ncbi:hypothetical protein Q8W71_17625 [Methylobacterium sp. NEAU 140]|uniref:hypothetical protein n=1 Tax=Methylobacterium sp. NEAU 140 TaxID=3064945 RepID=UPI00273407F4|nr:hypothetical protein [Methylobacterium sp. NEAU 140]MDP4024448.1 hypothetical protein [Methylobacterium sp. NEAU 140]
MPDIRREVIHRQDVRCFIGKAELEALVGRYALEQAGYAPDAPNLKVKVTFEDETAGSPSYRIGTKAKVEIVETLDPANNVQG